MSDEPTTRTRFREPAAAPVRPPAVAPEAAQPVASPTDASPPPAAAPAEAPAAAPAAPAGAGRRNTVLLVTSTALAVLLLAAAIVFAVLNANSRSDASTLAATRRTVLTTAQQAAVDFSSYDYRHLDSDFSKVAAQLTPKFRTEYRSTATALKATLSQYQAVGTAKVLEAGIVSLSGNNATVIMFLDQTVTGKTSKTPTVERNRIRVRLERSNGTWLVAKLDVR